MKVALLIPTMNRPQFIKRAVNYYDSLKSPHPMYIGDASNTETSNKIQSFLKKIKNVEIKYFHWEKLSGEQTMIKLAEKASVECEYCAFQGDDDYFIPTSLTKCATFLSENSDYRTAQGLAALVQTDSSESICNIKWTVEYWEKNSLEQSSKMERLLYFHKNYYVMQFSVHRVNEFIIDSQVFATILDPMFHEQTHCYTFAINGKSKFIDCLYLVRVSHPGLPTWKPFGFYELMFRKNWFENYNKMIDSLSFLINDDKTLTFKAKKDLIYRMITERFVIRLKKTIFQFERGTKKSFYEELKTMIPENFKIRLRLIKNKLLKKELRLLMTKHSRFYYDFLPVQRSLTNKGFSNNKK